MAEAQQGNSEIEQRIEALDVKLEKRLDEVYEALGQGFAEHRELALDRFEKVDTRFDAVDARLAVVDSRLEAHALDTTARFDRLEQKLDAFVDAQAAVNQRILKHLGA